MRAVGGVFTEFRHHHFKNEDCCFRKCDGMCCNDPFCREDEDEDRDDRFVFCVCFDRLRRCWVDLRTGFCVDINRLRL
jgi:hypothetical protein